MTEQKPQVIQKRICESLTYDRYSGVVSWRKTNNQHSWKTAGSIKKDRNGKRYIRIIIDGCHVSAHVVAWFLTTGEWRSGRIDHINGDGTDNRLANLREADRYENMKNKRRMKNNSSGFCGVVFHSRDLVWEARVNVRGKRITLGRFDNKDEAIRARAQANIDFGFHENHGKDRPL